MKKIILSLFIILSTIVITGCGNSKIEEAKSENINKEEILNQAQIFQKSNLDKAKKENIAKAKEDYNEKIFIWNTTIDDIKENYAMSDGIKIYFQDSIDLTKITKKESYIIIGKLDFEDSSLNQAFEITDNENLVWALTEIQSRSNREFYDYTFDKETGNITGYKEKGNWEPGTYNLNYDEHGRLISKERTDYHNDKTTINYTYNEDNNIETVTTECSNKDDIYNGRKEKITYKKDKQDRIIEKQWVNITEDNYTIIYRYEYDENNKIIKENQKSENSEYEIIYNYDKKGNLISEYSKRIDKKESGSTKTYKYSVIGVKNNTTSKPINTTDINNLYY